MEASCCGDYASPSPSPPVSTAATAEREWTAMTLLCIGFIVLFYGSIFVLCLVMYPKLPKDPAGDEESGDPLPPAVRYAKDGVKGGIRTEECVICLEDLEENDIVRVLVKCRHAFHVRCIDSWCMYRLACPVCRAPFRLAGRW